MLRWHENTMNNCLLRTSKASPCHTSCMTSQHPQPPHSGWAQGILARLRIKAQLVFRCSVSCLDPCQDQKPHGIFALRHRSVKVPTLYFTVRGGGAFHSFQLCTTLPQSSARISAHFFSAAAFADTYELSSWRSACRMLLFMLARNSCDDMDKSQGTTLFLAWPTQNYISFLFEFSS